MRKMIGLVRPIDRIDSLTHTLMILAESYGVPICSYNIFKLDRENKKISSADFWAKGSFVQQDTELPMLTEFQLNATYLKDNEDFQRSKKWLAEHTTITDNPGVPKTAVSVIMMKSPMFPFAIPTYAVSSFAELQNLACIIPNAIIKPSAGRKGIGVHHVLRDKGQMKLQSRNETFELTPESWAEYVSFLSKNDYGVPILQPRLDFSLDDKHAVDFRLLVARGGTGDWETVAIYPRIGSNSIVSNVSQGGYIGDAMEVLTSIGGEKAPELMDCLNHIAEKLPVLLQSYRDAPISSMGIDVGIDRQSLQPYVLEANAKPATKLHGWLLAEKKVQYYKYLLEKI